MLLASARVMPLTLVGQGDPRQYWAESEAADASVEIGGAPEIAFLLVIAALMCLALRLAGYWTTWTLASGLLLLVLGGLSLATLPAHPGGLLMFAFLAGSLALEVLWPGYGLHALGGGVSALFAGLYLTGDPPSTHPGVVVPVAVLVTVSVFMAGRRSWRYRRDQPFDTSGELVGRRTVVLTVRDAVAHGVVSGELWELRTPNGELREGAAVRIIEAREGWLVVTPARGQLHT